MRILWLIDSKIQFEENEMKVYSTGLKVLGHQSFVDENKAKWLIKILIRLMKPVKLESMEKIFLFFSTAIIFSVVVLNHSNKLINYLILLCEWLFLTYLIYSP